eukprot:3761498-Pleurochrysis_carterae.AAC.1
MAGETMLAANGPAERWHLSRSCAAVSRSAAWAPTQQCESKRVSGGAIRDVAASPRSSVEPCSRPVTHAAAESCSGSLASLSNGTNGRSNDGIVARPSSFTMAAMLEPHASRSSRLQSFSLARATIESAIRGRCGSKSAASTCDARTPYMRTAPRRQYRVCCAEVVCRHERSVASVEALRQVERLVNSSHPSCLVCASFSLLRAARTVWRSTCTTTMQAA